MNSLIQKTMILLFFLGYYGFLFYLLIHSQLRLDFASFYSAALAYAEGSNPYINLVTSYMATPVKLPANLNPPFFLQLLVPLTYFNFQWASAFWVFSSLILGSVGALLCFKICATPSFYNKYRLPFLFIYLGMYSTMMNASIGQMGGICLFLTMTGYYFYLQDKNYAAGLLWTVLIAIKLFPALLFFFVFNQRRYKVFLIMVCGCSLAFLIPILIRGFGIYSLYFNMLSRVAWLGDSWNASLYGFIFRLFVDLKAHSSLNGIKIFYLILFSGLLIGYIWKIRSWRKQVDHLKEDHREFCLTLLVMLLLSPFGWLYYFSLLLLPLLLLWSSLGSNNSSQQGLGALSLLLINFPMGYVEMNHMHSIVSKLSIYSIYFYGLILLVYLFVSIKNSLPLSFENANQHSIFVLYASLSLGIGVTLITILLNYP